MTGAVTGSSSTGLTTFLAATGLGAGLTTFGGGTLRTTFGGGFASSGVGSSLGGQEVQPMSAARTPDRVVPMIACFHVLRTVAS